MKRMIVIVALTLGLAGLSGANSYAQTVDMPAAETQALNTQPSGTQTLLPVRKWDLNVSAAYPGYMGYSSVGEGIGQAFGEVLAVIFTFGLYKPGSDYERQESMNLPAFALHAGYQVLPWLQVGADAFYHYGQRFWFVKKEDTIPGKKRFANSISFMPGCSFTYFNKGVFHLYSAAYVGVGYNFGKTVTYKTDPNTGEKITEIDPLSRVRVAFQTTPLGFAVGNSVYGLLELGLGSEYNGLRVGIGCKF